ncbi:GIN domain-containing protein [Persicobacter diffluens]|uniref:Putative auto-transporter adhesin head GIN domain-containing protein n=1 Tax=Persicobacter diffluens TaxID=981 RepID=A0AAN5AIE3_9BACT|nr:hypothetical protein PEDI_03660 [Persicobacter diffluens]
MEKLRFSLLSGLLFALVAFSSCKKDDPKPHSLTKELSAFSKVIIGQDLNVEFRIGSDSRAELRGFGNLEEVTFLYNDDQLTISTPEKTSISQLTIYLYTNNVNEKIELEAKSQAKVRFPDGFTTYEDIKLIAKDQAEVSSHGVFASRNISIYGSGTGSKIFMDNIIPQTTTIDLKGQAICNLNGRSPKKVQVKAAGSSSLNMVENPFQPLASEHYELDLSDGAKVWVNASVKISGKMTGGAELFYKPLNPDFSGLEREDGNRVEEKH